MELKEVAQILDAQVLCGQDKLDLQVTSACGSDLMSDVMAFVKDQVLLLTGLMNIQVIRTANLMDIQVVCFVRGKSPSQEMIDMAEELGIVLMSTKLPLFLSCGKLYNAGLTGGGTRKIY